MRQTKRFIFVVAAVAGWGWGTAHAQDAPAVPESGTQGTAQNPPGGSAAGQLITASAKVNKVDVAKRELTLQSDDGKPFTINVPESVTRLDNVKPGDQVHISFYESVAVSLQKPGEAMVGEQKRTFNERAAGNLPGGVMGQQVTTTAKITQIDPAKGELSIETPTGKADTIQATDPQLRAELKKLKVGDEIRARYTQAMATSVTRQRAM